MFELLKAEKIIIFSKKLRVRIIRASELIEDIRYYCYQDQCFRCHMGRCHSTYMYYYYYCYLDQHVSAKWYIIHCRVSGHQPL